MKHIFDFLRKISGGKLTQKQVDAADKLIATAYDDVTSMLGIATDEMSISPSGIDLIRNFESLRLNAYDDGVGVWTIGYGTTKYLNGIRVKKGDTCTLEQAKSYMQHDLKKFEQTVKICSSKPEDKSRLSLLAVTVWVAELEPDVSRYFT